MGTEGTTGAIGLAVVRRTGLFPSQRRRGSEHACFRIGGVETVTLGDDEARARRTQKSVLERKAPPTFPFLIEMRERHYWVTHRTESSVDMLLHGKKPLVEVRKRDNKFQVVIERWATYDGDGL